MYSSLADQIMDEIVGLVMPKLTVQMQSGSLMASVERAKNGDADTKLLHMRLIEEEFFRHLEGVDFAQAKRLVTSYYETLANGGSATAMRYTASAYANGYHVFTAVKTERGYRFNGESDYQTAFNWASKAAAAGDEIARDKFVPSLKRELEERKGPKV